MELYRNQTLGMSILCDTQISLLSLLIAFISMYNNILMFFTLLQVIIQTRERVTNPQDSEREQEDTQYLHYDFDDKDDVVFYKVFNNFVPILVKGRVWEEEKQRLQPPTALLYFSFIDG